MHAARQTSTGCAGRLVLHGKREEPARVVRPDLLDYAPAYRVWGYPWTPALFVLASVTIVVNRLVFEPLDRAIGLGIVALSVPAYYAWTATRQRVRLHEAAA